MARWSNFCLAFAVSVTALAQQGGGNKPAPKQDAPAAQETQLPPEEDASEKPPESYSFNPVKSKKDVEVGNLYFKKGNFKAAAGRFTEATKWNDGNAEAWLRLGDAEEKRENNKAARAAWEHYLQVAPDAKNAPEVRKKLERIR